MIYRTELSFTKNISIFFSPAISRKTSQLYEAALFARVSSLRIHKGFRRNLVLGVYAESLLWDFFSVFTRPVFVSKISAVTSEEMYAWRYKPAP
jgi:hypothetical protein